MHFLCQNCYILTIALKFVAMDPIGDKPVLVQIVACGLFDAKPVSEPVLVYFTDGYIHHWLSVS